MEHSRSKSSPVQPAQSIQAMAPVLGPSIQGQLADLSAQTHLAAFEEASTRATVSTLRQERDALIAHEQSARAEADQLAAEAASAEGVAAATPPPESPAPAAPPAPTEGGEVDPGVAARARDQSSLAAHQQARANAASVRARAASARARAAELSTRLSGVSSQLQGAITRHHAAQSRQAELSSAEAEARSLLAVQEQGSRLDLGGPHNEGGKPWWSAPLDSEEESSETSFYQPDLALRLGEELALRDEDVIFHGGPAPLPMEEERQHAPVRVPNDDLLFTTVVPNPVSKVQKGDASNAAFLEEGLRLEGYPANKANHRSTEDVSKNGDAAIQNTGSQPGAEIKQYGTQLTGMGPQEPPLAFAVDIHEPTFTTQITPNPVQGEGVTATAVPTPEAVIDPEELALTIPKERVGQGLGLFEFIEQNPAFFGMTPELGKAFADSHRQGDPAPLVAAGLSEEDAKIQWQVMESNRRKAENTSHQVHGHHDQVIDDSVGRDEVVLNGVTGFDQVDMNRVGDDLSIVHPSGGTTVIKGYYGKGSSVARIRLGDVKGNHVDTTLYREEMKHDTSDFLDAEVGADVQYHHRTIQQGGDSDPEVLSTIVGRTETPEALIDQGRYGEVTVEELIEYTTGWGFELPRSEEAEGTVYQGAYDPLADLKLQYGMVEPEQGESDTLLGNKPDPKGYEIAAKERLATLLERKKREKAMAAWAEGTRTDALKDMFGEDIDDPGLTQIKRGLWDLAEKDAHKRNTDSYAGSRDLEATMLMAEVIAQERDLIHSLNLKSQDDDPAVAEAAKAERAERMAMYMKRGEKNQTAAMVLNVVSICLAFVPVVGIVASAMVRAAATIAAGGTVLDGIKAGVTSWLVAGAPMAPAAAATSGAASAGTGAAAGAASNAASTTASTAASTAASSSFNIPGWLSGGGLAALKGGDGGDILKGAVVGQINQTGALGPVSLNDDGIALNLGPVNLHLGKGGKVSGDIELGAGISVGRDKDGNTSFGYQSNTTKVTANESGEVGVSHSVLEPGAVGPQDVPMAAPAPNPGRNIGLTVNVRNGEFNGFVETGFQDDKGGLSGGTRVELGHDAEGTTRFKLTTTSLQAALDSEGNGEVVHMAEDGTFEIRKQDGSFSFGMADALRMLKVSDDGTVAFKRSRVTGDGTPEGHSPDMGHVFESPDQIEEIGGSFNTETGEGNAYRHTGSSDGKGGIEGGSRIDVSRESGTTSARYAGERFSWQVDDNGNAAVQDQFNGGTSGASLTDGVIGISYEDAQTRMDVNTDGQGRLSLDGGNTIVGVTDGEFYGSVARGEKRITVTPDGTITFDGQISGRKVQVDSQGGYTFVEEKNGQQLIIEGNIHLGVPNARVVGEQKPEKKKEVEEEGEEEEAEEWSPGVGLHAYEVVPDDQPLEANQIHQSQRDRLDRYNFSGLDVVGNDHEGPLAPGQMKQAQYDAIQDAWLNITAGKGMKLRGRGSDKESFLQMLRESMGQSSVLREQIADIGNDSDESHTLVLRLGRNQSVIGGNRGVLGDAFFTAQVDLADLDFFNATPGVQHADEVTRTELLAHFLSERRAAITSGAPRDFSTHHEHALKVQNEVRKEFGQQAVVRQVIKSNIQGGVDLEFHMEDGLLQVTETDSQDVPVEHRFFEGR